MSKIFSDYSRFYDLIYSSKDYAGETDFVLLQLFKHASRITEILDLGCGTGRHADAFEKRGFRITGVDASSEMLGNAKKMFPDADKDKFVASNFSDLNLEKTFDAVVSLFHVFSYQTRDEDIQSFLNCVRRHMHEGSVAFIDFWYGPAVLKHGLMETKKSFLENDLSVKRNSIPLLRANSHVVDVNIHLEISIGGKKAGLIEETHPMRFFFLDEISGFARMADLELVQHGHWSGGRDESSPDSWGAYIVLRPLSGGIP